MKKIVKVSLITLFALIAGVLLLSWLTTSVEPFKSFTQMSNEEVSNLGAEHGKELREQVNKVIDNSQ